MGGKKGLMVDKLTFKVVGFCKAHVYQHHIIQASVSFKS